MKPKKARLHFMKKQYGVLAYPGWRTAMFPNFNEDEIENIKNQKKQDKLKNKIENKIFRIKCKSDKVIPEFILNPIDE